MATAFDRTLEDLGNSVGLEHVNTTVPDQQMATLFYITGLGLTRDPYLVTGLENMWINVGRSQFHLPHNKTAQVVRGHVGLVLPDLEALLRRLTAVKPRLANTQFDFTEQERYVETTSPWGNKIRCYLPNEEQFGAVRLGMPYVELSVPPGAAAGIDRFYREIMETPSTVAEDAEGRLARVTVGIGQHLLFRETDAPLAPYDGHHIQIYVANFSGPHRRLKEKELITEESNQWQYRFKEITDPESGKSLYTLEHEVRSITHPLFARPLVNRDPAQTNQNYRPGYDATQWALAQEA